MAKYSFEFNEEVVKAHIAYVRVSTMEQNEQRQFDGLNKHNIEKWFTEKVSAKDTNRPQLNSMLDYAREGIAIAKAQGKFKGRKEVHIPNFKEHYMRYKNRQVSKAQLAKELNILRPTLDKLINKTYLSKEKNIPI